MKVFFSLSSVCLFLEAETLSRGTTENSASLTRQRTDRGACNRVNLSLWHDGPMGAKPEGLHSIDFFLLLLLEEGEDSLRRSFS